MLAKMCMNIISSQISINRINLNKGTEANILLRLYVEEISVPGVGRAI